MVGISVKVHSASSGWSNILHFTATGADCCKLGDRVPGIYLNKNNKIRISSAVGTKGDFWSDYKIELNKEYHIEIVQEKTNGKVRKYR